MLHQETELRVKGHGGLGTVSLAVSTLASGAPVNLLLSSSPQSRTSHEVQMTSDLPDWTGPVWRSSLVQ